MMNEWFVYVVIDSIVRIGKKETFFDRKNERNFVKIGI